MTDTTYNGWTNWETWNVNLWIENEESLYQCKRSMLRHITDQEQVQADDVRAFFRDYMNGTTPDFADRDDDPIKWGYELAAINFDEIAKHWEGERQEMLDEV